MKYPPPLLTHTHSLPHYLIRHILTVAAPVVLQVELLQGGRWLTHLGASVKISYRKIRETIFKKRSFLLDICQNWPRQPLTEWLILLDVDLHVIVEVPPLGVLVLQPPGGAGGQGGAAGGGGRVRHLGGGVEDFKQKWKMCIQRVFFTRN